MVLLVIMQRQQFFDVGVVPQIQFIVRCEQREVPKGSSSSWTGLLAGPVLRNDRCRCSRGLSTEAWKNSTNFSRALGLWSVSPRLLLEEFHIFYVEVVPEPFALEIWTFSTCSSYGGTERFSAHFAPFFSDSVPSNVRSRPFWSTRWPTVVDRRGPPLLISW